MAHEELIAALLKVEGNRPDNLGISTQWHRNPEGPQAVEALTTAQAEIEALRARVAELEGAWKRASELISEERGPVGTHRRAFARYIAQHEQPPVDRLRLIVKGRVMHWVWHGEKRGSERSFTGVNFDELVDSLTNELRARLPAAALAAIDEEGE